MDINKYTLPSIPSAQHILEDLCDPDIIKSNQPLNLSNDEEIVQVAYTCYQTYLQLEGDQEKQLDLSSNLDELNKKLVESIGNMKKQIKTK